MVCFYPLVNEEYTKLLSLVHRNREISQLVQTERPPPNSYEGAEAQGDALDWRH